ncbi:M67 family metallopeptidase [Natronospora cellulosivora (SeqCode)]
MIENLYISKDDYQMIVDYSLKGKPLEVCGIIAGTKEEDSYKTAKVYLMKNTAASAEEYLMEPEEQFEVFKDIRENDTELIAIFHSHPHSPARPSLKDIDMAHYPDAVYVIVSLENLAAIDFKGFIIKDNAYREVKITIEK